MDGAIGPVREVHVPLIVVSGIRPLRVTVRLRLPRPGRSWTGTCGWGRRRTSLTILPTIPGAGATGAILARDR